MAQTEAARRAWVLALASSASFMVALDAMVVTTAEIGKASGAFNVFRYLGVVFGVALLVEVFARSGGAASVALPLVNPLKEQQ